MSYEFYKPHAVFAVTKHISILYENGDKETFKETFSINRFDSAPRNFKNRFKEAFEGLMLDDLKHAYDAIGEAISTEESIKE
jgi:hypothetical protein